MKKRIITLSIIGLFALGLASCNASKGGGHCPAYGN